MMNRTTVPALVALVAFALNGCSSESCHMGEHVGGFDGDLQGVLYLDVSRVDADDLVDLTLEGDAEGLPLTAHLVAESAREGGCSDVMFEGALVDASGAEVGTIDGALTTTTGEGTWTLDSGEAGTWSLGKH